MPTEAFIAAASAANRQPVVLLAIESINAIKRQVTTQADWQAAALTDINTTLVPGEVRLATDDAEPLPGPYYNGVNPYTDSTVVAGEIVTPVFYSGTHVSAIHITGIYVLTNFGDDSISIITMHLYGRKDGGAWQLLADRTQTGGAYDDIYLDLDRGTWEFKATVTQTGTAYILEWISLNYQSRRDVRYLASGSLTTAATGLDLGTVPTIDSRFEADDIIPTGCSIVYTAWGKDTAGGAWSALGTVVDGDTLTAYRYYQLQADLAGSTDGMESPTIRELRIVGGNSQFTYLSTHKDLPIQGALPYIAPGGISSVSSKIDLTQQATVGELTVKLIWNKFTGDLVAGDALKNKTISCRLGFVGLSEVDFEPYFVGTWYDYQADHEKMTITVKTRNILKRFNKKIPEAAYFLMADGKTVYYPPKLKTYSGNALTVMLTIADELGIPDRLLNRDTFTALAAGSRSGTDWDVSRSIAEPTDAMEMLNELSVSTGVFLFEGADGRLTAKLYDDFSTAAETATINAMHYKFRAVEGGQKDLSTRQAIYYQLLPGTNGGSSSDYGKCEIFTNTAAEITWEETNTREWKDRWNISVVAVQLLGQRWGSWFSTPRPTVRVDDVSPRLYGIERGQVVAVDNLRLPCPSGDWQGYTDGTRFLVMGKSVSDPTTGNLTVSFDLMQLEAATFTTDPDFPDYSRLDWWPDVAALSSVWSNITGTGKPADNAGRIFRYGDDLSVAVYGDLYIDSSVTPALLKHYDGSAWTTRSSLISNTTGLLTEQIETYGVTKIISGTTGDITAVPATDLSGGFAVSVIGAGTAQSTEIFAIISLDGAYYGNSGEIQIRNGSSIGSGTILATMKISSGTVGIFRIVGAPYSGGTYLNISATVNIKYSYIELGWRAFKR